MKLPKSILRGYDRVTEKTIAKALGMNVPKKKAHKKRLFQLRHLKKRGIR